MADEMDATFVNLEKKLDTKLEARLEDLKREMQKSIGEEGTRRKETGVETFEELDEAISQLREFCKRNQEDIDDLGERLLHLEERMNTKEKEEDFWNGDLTEGF
jgi:uncharacterized coiled-coil protein SlyX